MLPVLADGTNRTTTSDTKLGPHLIPKGTMVWVPLKGLFNSPHNWLDPDQYKPARLAHAQPAACSLISTQLRACNCPVEYWLVQQKLNP